MASAPVIPLWLRRLRALQRKLLSSPPPSLSGSVDRVMPNEVIGWTWDKARPGTRLLVEASASGVVLGRALADMPRRDLVAEGVGDGRHGFRIRLEKPLPAGGQIIVEAVNRWRRTQIQFGAKAYPPTTVERASPAGANRVQVKTLPQLKSKTPSVGFLDRVNGCNLEGWAVNPHAVNGSATIDLYDDEIYLGSVLANLERPRLQESGAPPGARGFSFDLTPIYSAGLLRRVRARIAGTSYDLKRGLHLPTTVEVLERAQLGAQIPDSAFDDAQRRQTPKSEFIPAIRERKLLSLLCGGESILIFVGFDLDQERRIDAGDETALRSLLADADLVLFAPAGATPAWQRLRAIESEFPAASVFIEDRGDNKDASGARAALDLAAWGEAPCVFAVSGPALERLQDLESGDLIGADWLAITRRLAAMPRLKWGVAAPGDLVESVPQRERTTVAPCGAGVKVPSRVSLAVRNGWTDGPPTTLVALIHECSGLHVDVLAPSRADASILMGSLRPPASALASLTYRQVDGFTEGEFWSGLRASVGQVLLVATDTVDCVSASDIQRLCSWAMRPGVGFVSIGDPDAEGQHSASLLALSRQALAELDVDLAGRLDDQEEQFDELLARRGRLRLRLPTELDIANGKSKRE